MHHDIDLYKQTYDKHKHLKNAAEELGIKWQNLYWYLSQAGHPVTGDKERYGCDKDKFAKFMENKFKEIVPFARDFNKDKFQAIVDFEVKGFKVDIKASTKKDGYKANPLKNPSPRWAFSLSTQKDVADFLVCFCMSGEDCTAFGVIDKILLIPREYFCNKQSISVSIRKSKWFDFEVTEEDLLEFFESI